MFYLETAAISSRVGEPGGYSRKENALADAEKIALTLDIPIDIVEIKDADRVYACGCSNDVTCYTHLEEEEMETV